MGSSLWGEWNRSGKSIGETLRAAKSSKNRGKSSQEPGKGGGLGSIHPHSKSKTKGGEIA